MYVLLLKSALPLGIIPARQRRGRVLLPVGSQRRSTERSFGFSVDRRWNRHDGSWLLIVWAKAWVGKLSMTWLMGLMGVRDGEVMDKEQGCNCC